ncbi:mannose-1-phosphate guanylyltransferase [Gramella sp. BOM4]|nr:mannose-1-phosphate guanylyltransferase [Christiangramia bathymodioli]
MSRRKNDKYYAILMAGGVGSRFWPSSKASNPKQFIDILGVGESLFQITFKRLSRLIPSENILVLTNRKYVDKIKNQVPEIKDEQIVPEPEMRNTAPSILLGALKIRKMNPEGRIVVAPCDHWIQQEDEFLDVLETAFESLENQDRLLTLGVQPDSPNTGYGYIEFDKADKGEIKKVKKFTEKPDLATAEAFLEAGNYVWNAGIFIWSADFIVRNFRKHLPGMYAIFEEGLDNLNTERENDFLKENYAKSDNISIDYGIMEKARDVYVIPVSFSWNDLGTWTSVQKELSKDENGNTLINTRLEADNATNNIISTFNGKIVALKGLSDFIIVEDENVLMIVPKSEEQEIKKLREEVMKKYGNDLG